MMDKQCTFRTIKNVFWNNRGRYVIAFPKGGVYSGTAYCDEDGTVKDVSSRSLIYGVSDYVDMECIEILEIHEPGGERSDHNN